MWCGGGTMMQQRMDVLTGIATTLGLQSPSSLDPASCGVQSPSLSVSRLLTVAGLSSTPPTLCTGGLKLLPWSISNLVMQLCLELAVLLCSSSRLGGISPPAAGVFGASGENQIKPPGKGERGPGPHPTFPRTRVHRSLPVTPLLSADENTKNHPKRHGLSNTQTRNLYVKTNGLAADWLSSSERPLNDFRSSSFLKF